MSESSSPGHEELLAHAGFVRALALSLVRDRHHAEDLAQEALVVGIENGAAAKRGLRAWLRGVTRNLALAHGRSEARRRRREGAAAREDRSGPTVDLAARLETQRRMIEAVQALSEPYQSTIVARFYDGLEPREIARETGVPVETVRTRLQRGIERLRRHLDEGTGGGRRAWTAALLPLFSDGRAIPAAAAGAAPAATALGVKAAMGTAVAAVVASVTVALWTGGADPAAPEPSGGDPAAVVLERSRSVRPAPQPGALARIPDPAEYLRRINSGEGAYEVALEITRLPPERGRDVVLAIYGDIEGWGRRHEVRKAFVFEGHPFALAVVDLALADPSEWVRAGALEYMEETFLRPFGLGEHVYREWVARHGGASLRDALRDGAREYVRRLHWLAGADLAAELGRLRAGTERHWRSAGLDLRAEMREAGILDVLEASLAAPEIDARVLEAAFRWIRLLVPDEEFLERTLAPLLARAASLGDREVSRVLDALGGARNGWAVPHLIRLFEGEPSLSARSWAHAAAAFGRIGDRRAVPVLIAVVEARPSEALRLAAVESLCALTGVAPGEERDGGPWRRWWAESRRRSGEGTRDMEIPAVRLPGQALAEEE